MPSPQVTVGNVTIQALLDVRFALPLSRMFASVPAEDWAQYKTLYPWAFNEDMIVTNATCYLLRTGGRTVLLDMGLGQGPHQNQGGAMGDLLNELAAAGVAPDGVDAVVVSHLHGDHIGWAVSNGQPTFPRARVLVSQADWDFFGNPEHPQHAAVQSLMGPLQSRGLLELVTGEHKVNDELAMVPTPGHTPGHCSLLVRSSGEGAIFTGDTIHSPAQVSETDWSPVFDADADQSAESRWNVVQRADVEKLIVAANHMPFPGFGRIIRVGGRRSFERLSAE